MKPIRPDTVARSLAIGNPADGDFAVAAARVTGGAIYAVAEDERAENMVALAETTGVFGETATGVTLGALRRAVEERELGASDRVVLLVTGDGLKTPEHVASRLEPVEIEPDADARPRTSGSGLTRRSAGPHDFFPQGPSAPSPLVSRVARKSARM